MAKIVSQTNSVQIGDIEFPKNTLFFSINANKGEVVIKRLNGDVVTQGSFQQFRNNLNVPYGSLNDLVAALRTALFD